MWEFQLGNKNPPLETSLLSIGWDCLEERLGRNEFHASLASRRRRAEAEPPPKINPERRKGPAQADTAASQPQQHKKRTQKQPPGCVPSSAYKREGFPRALFDPVFLFIYLYGGSCHPWGSQAVLLGDEPIQKKSRFWVPRGRVGTVLEASPSQDQFGKDLSQPLSPSCPGFSPFPPPRCSGLPEEAPKQPQKGLFLPNCSSFTHLCPTLTSAAASDPCSSHRPEPSTASTSTPLRICSLGGAVGSTGVPKPVQTSGSGPRRRS